MTTLTFFTSSPIEFAISPLVPESISSKMIVGRLFLREKIDFNANKILDLL